MQTHHAQEEDRRKKLEVLRKQAIQPYGGAFPKRESIQALLSHYEEGRAVSTAGRLSAKRGHGGLSFADLRDGSGKAQICVKQDKVGEPAFQLFQNLDLGDILGVSGTFFKTKTGEPTIQVETITILSKSLHPLPEKWHGLKDVEIRYRKRYLDLIANEETRTVFTQRSRLVASLRRTLDGQGFIEVETPMMQPLPGGAAGDPFVTHHQALDLDLYLRLAPELYLKQLLVGGLERVYEVNRSFRNEGLSTQHNPEFTMLEAYAAYSDYEGMMRLVEALIVGAAKETIGGTSITFREQSIDLAPPWDVVSFARTMEDLGLSPDSPLEKIQAVLERKGMKVKGLHRSQLVRLVEQLFEPKTRQKPLYVTEYWTELSPLAKSKPDNPLITERFELYIGGMEIANAYSELNDPIEQRRRFEAQAAGSRLGAGGSGQPQLPRAQSPEPRAKVVDEAFLEALEYGMPPAGGLGVGVDRLAMLLFNQPTIKDVILFPILKPDGA